MNLDTSIFPDEFASNHEKKQKSFGKDVGKAIGNQWFNGQLTSRRAWINEMRSYARGEQCTKKYTRTIEGDKKRDSKIKSYKIDYTPLKIMPSFMDIVLNPIDESLFKPRAEAVDKTSVNKKKNYIKKLEQDYYTKEFSEIQSINTGVDVVNKNIPKNKHQLEVKKLEFKPLIELAQELAIESVMKSEKFETIKDAIDPDLFSLGIGVGRHYTDYTEGIKTKYVDIYNYIHSPFEMEDGRDIRYHGIVEKGTIGELIKQAGGLTADELKAIKNYAMGKANNENGEAYNENEDKNRMVEFVTFSYLVSEKRVFKKLKRNRTTVLIDRTNDEDEYNPSNTNKKTSIPYQVWYEGVYVPKADVIIKWDKIPNQAESGVNIPICPFIVYAPKVKKLSELGEVRFDSMINRCIPFIDDLHRDYYKQQQLKMELRPNTVKISPKVLNQTLLNGMKINSLELLDMYFGRGVLLADEYNDDGEKIGNAITENGGGINNSALGFLSAEFQNSYNKIRKVLGINEVRDGTTKPNSKTAVSVQKILLSSSNNQTSHIVKASFNISLRFAEAISSRLYDVLTTKALKDRYADMIGSENVDLLSELLKYPMSKFAIYFDFKPDNEERLTLEHSILEAYHSSYINVAQYNKARLIRNVKNGIKYLEYTVEENIIKSEKNKRENIIANAEANSKQSVLTEQTKQQTLTIKSEIDIRKLYVQEQIKSDEERRKSLSDEVKAKANHRRAMELRRLELSIKASVENEKEDKKDKREDQRTLNQAKLIDKRKNGTPVTFEDEIGSIFRSEQLPTQETK